jgi:putative FmdB family regulatory protein
MPIYEYVCDDCQAQFEQIVMSAKQKIACPKCGSKHHTLQLSVFSAGKSAHSSSSAAPAASCGSCCHNPNTCGYN